MIKKISTQNAPAAIGPYCQAMAVNGMLFTSGQLGLDPATGDFAGDNVTAQADQALRNLGAILKEAGTDYDKIVKTTCFLADMGDFAAFNEVYARYITNTPARSCVAVKTLPKGGLVEVEAIAVIE